MRPALLLLPAMIVSCAQPSGPRPEVAAGARLAQRLCAECHAVAAGGASPMKEAPRFDRLGEVFPLERLDEALAKGWLQDLPHMKAFSELDIDQRAQLVGYIRSLQRKPGNQAMVDRDQGRR